MRIRETRVKSILTRASGYLRTVSSHSLQPYRGCSFGSSLCGVGCYVQHNTLLTRGEAWGAFLDVRTNAPEVYRAQAPRERRWARRNRSGFSIFMSSATDPFLPQERTYGVTDRILEAMHDEPPDLLIVQSHTRAVAGPLRLFRSLSQRCELRIHFTVESDREGLPGLPPPASSVDERLAAARLLRDAGLRVVVTVSPLLPIDAPERFFRRIAECADATVIDHFIGGDGTANGARTALTPLPSAMESIDPESTSLAYRDRIVDVARGVMPGRVGVGIDGFAGRLLPR